MSKPQLIPSISKLAHLVRFEPNAALLVRLVIKAVIDIDYFGIEAFPYFSKSLFAAL